jgi:hypothetical protein
MKKQTVRGRHDRWADWAVIGLLAVALLLGWAVMSLAQGQRATYTNAEVGLTVRYPQGWLLKGSEKLVFQALDPDSGPFKTTYQVRAWPIDATARLTPTLSSVLNDASLSRAQEGIAYRMFDVVEGRGSDTQPAMEATYVYVVESADFFVQQMPVVVQGLDVAVAQGGRAYVFSLLAEEDLFEAALPAFRRFVETADLQ